MKIKLGVIFGGETVGHEVSIISAVQAMNKINQEKYDIIPIYITKDGEWYTGNMLMDVEVYGDLDLLKKYATNVILYKKDGAFVLQSKGLFKKIITDLDIVFPITHGTNVEDGTLQGYLQTIGVPYVGPNVYSAVVAQDKAYMKDIFKANNMSIVDYVWFTREEFEANEDEILDKIYSKIDYPYIVKPCSLGSSIGISKCECEDDLIYAIEVACKYDSRIIVEKAVENLREINCACIGYGNKVRTSMLEEPVSWNKFLSFKDKYLSFSKSATRGEPNLEEDIKEKIKETAVKAFISTCQSGVVRIDFLLDSLSGELFINEINTIPGSLANYLFPEHFGKLIDELITLAIKRENDKKKNNFSYKSAALFEYIKNSGKMGTKKY